MICKKNRLINASFIPKKHLFLGYLLLSAIILSGFMYFLQFNLNKQVMTDSNKVATDTTETQTIKPLSSADQFQYGIFRGSWNFKDEPVGQHVPEGFQSFVGYHENNIYIAESTDNHNKTLMLDDAAGNPIKVQANFTSQSPRQGTVEYWIKPDRYCSGWIMNETNVFINILFTDWDSHSYDILANGIDIGDFNTGSWYHISVYFDLDLLKYNVSINGTLVANNFNISADPGAAHAVQFGGGYSETGIFYVDAIGYDWDPNYHVGDNYYLEIESNALLYNASWNFKDEPAGQHVPEGFQSFVGYHENNIYIKNAEDNHAKVLMMDDAAGNPIKVQANFTNQSPRQGTVEYWIKPDRYCSGWIMNETNVFINILFTDWDSHSYDILANGIDIGDFNTGSWYHISVYFDLDLLKYNVSIDGTLVANNFNISADPGAAHAVQFGGGYSETGIFYVDAIGYDWDSNYNVGDNLNGSSPQMKEFTSNVYNEFELSWWIEDFDWTSITIERNGSEIANKTGSNIPIKYNDSVTLAGKYNYSCVVKDSAGNIGFISIFGTILPSMIETPSITTNTSLSLHGNYTVSWTNSSYATTYYLYKNTSPITGIDNLSAIYIGPNLSYNETNVPPGIYYYAVIAGNSTLNSSLSENVNISVQYPTAQPILSITNSSSEEQISYILSWNNVEFAFYYLLYRTSENITNSSDLLGKTPIYNGTNTNFNDSNLAENRSYYYVVLASNGFKNSPISNVIYLKTQIMIINNNTNNNNNNSSGDENENTGEEENPTPPFPPKLIIIIIFIFGSVAIVGGGVAGYKIRQQKNGRIRFSDNLFDKSSEDIKFDFKETEDDEFKWDDDDDFDFDIDIQKSGATDVLKENGADLKGHESMYDTLDKSPSDNKSILLVPKQENTFDTNEIKITAETKELSELLKDTPKSYFNHNFVELNYNEIKTVLGEDVLNELMSDPDIVQEIKEMSSEDLRDMIDYLAKIDRIYNNPKIMATKNINKNNTPETWQSEEPLEDNDEQDDNDDIL